MSESKAMDERDWLVNVLNGIYGPGSVTDIGYDFVQEHYEVVYENALGRFEVTIKELPR